VKDGYMRMSMIVCPNRKVYSEWYQNMHKYPVSWWGYDHAIWTCSNYGYNYRYLGQNWNAGTQPANNARIAKPAATIVEGDSAMQGRTGGNQTLGWYIVNPYYFGDSSGGPNLWPTHDRGRSCNTLWVDGHVTGEKGRNGVYENALRSLSAKGSVFYGTYDPSAGTVDQNTNWDRF